VSRERLSGKRDAEWMGKKLRVSWADRAYRSRLDDSERVRYAADITYAQITSSALTTCRQMKFEIKDCVQRGHYHAIVDEGIRSLSMKRERRDYLWTTDQTTDNMRAWYRCPQTVKGEEVEEGENKYSPDYIVTRSSARMGNR